MTAKSAVVLLSGGLDSATTLVSAIKAGYSVSVLSFKYGQVHSRELKAARELVKHYNIQRHEIIELDLRKIGKSALIDTSSAIPENRDLDELATEIPTTYVPARNIIMLSCAVAMAESIGAQTVFIGVNTIDYSGYPDCRPDFISAFEHAAELGTKVGVEGNKIKIETPLINLTKSEIIKLGQELNVPFELTWTCYKGGPLACGRCDSCKLRLKGFFEAGLEDPLDYEEN